LRTGVGAQEYAIDQGLRSYMLRVYNYMAGGLAITGLVAWFAFQAAIQDTGAGIALSPFGQALYASPLKWLVILAPLGLVFYLSARISRMSVGGAQAA